MNKQPSARLESTAPGVFAKNILPLIGIHARTFRIARQTAWPVVDLIIRFWLAQTFFVSGVLKITNWQTALNLAASEYPVSWMSPVTAAYTGVTIELVAPVLLMLGLMTRYAALPMLILSLVVQFNYQAFDSQLFSAALFGWYVIHGASALSLDRLMRRGLADSALPFIPSIIRASAWVREHLTGFYLTLVRAWLAAAFFIVAFNLSSSASTNDSALWFPVATFASYSTELAAVLGVSLLLGIATRYAALLLMASAMIGAMSDSQTIGAVGLFVTAILFLQGAGRLSFDEWSAVVLRNHYPELSGRATFSLEGLPRIVIVGAGFGGLTCANALRNVRASITLIDRANYHLFQPLLYQVATAGLSPGDIAAPVRPLFRDAFNTRVLLGSITDIDTQGRRVKLGNKEVPYDYLVLATGAAHSYFGKDHWAAFAPGLKRIEDATAIRRKLLNAFEQAEATDDAEERQSLLTFLIVGGGPTGVELAGAIAELARYGMEKEFRRFDPASARIALVQSAPRLLPAFPEKLASIAQQSLEQLGVEVMLGSRVENIDADGVTVSGKRIQSRSVLWAAGVMASPAAKWLKVDSDNAGRIKVDERLSVPGLANVYALGDTALSNAWNGQPVPGLAPAAKQGGKYVADVIRSQLENKSLPAPFVYRHRGSLATIGRKSAVADFGFIKLWGAPAWWLWGLVHVGFLVGMRNRMSTMINWFWSYLTFGGGIRLITGDVMPSQEKINKIESRDESAPVVAMRARG